MTGFTGLNLTRRLFCLILMAMLTSISLAHKLFCKKVIRTYVRLYFLILWSMGSSFHPYEQKDPYSYLECLELYQNHLKLFPHAPCIPFVLWVRQKNILRTNISIIHWIIMPMQAHLHTYHLIRNSSRLIIVNIIETRLMVLEVSIHLVITLKTPGVCILLVVYTR